jgi:tripartite-type tricarboxylate transporter receptor subunit TctC
MMEPVAGLRKHVGVLAACVLSLGFVLSQPAQAAYPERPIRLIHGFGAGGPADSLSRVLADAMAPELGQPLVVEAKPGAGGNIGADAVAKAEPDGYTIGFVTGAHAVSAALYKQLPFDPVESFQMISTVLDFGRFIVAARPSAETSSLPQLIAAAKAKPGSINYGSSGVGSTQHLASELLNATAGTRMVHVPYRGDAAAVMGLLGDQVQMVIAAATTVLPQIQSGALKALAVTTAARWDRMPDLPTVAESGVSGYEVRTWYGIVAPKGIPAPVLERLRTSLAAAMAKPDVATRLENIVGATARTSSPEEMRSMVASEVARWKKVIAEAGIPQQ